MEALLPDDALFGRMGGEEFACLLTGVTPDQALVQAEFLRAAVTRISVPELPQLTVSVSIGLAAAQAAPARARGASTGEPWTGRLDELLRRADAALYEAKRNGRDRSEIAPPALRRAA